MLFCSNGFYFSPDFIIRQWGGGSSFPDTL